MHDPLIRESLKACLSESRFSQERQREVLAQIRKEHTMKRKLSYSFVFAAVLVLAFGTLALAAGLGLFGTFAGHAGSSARSDRLLRLEDAAQTVGASETIAAPDVSAMPQAGATLRDTLIAQQSSRTFDLTLNQAYCDGQKLYYSYTLKTNRKDLVFGEGKPSGFDNWDMESPGMTVADTWSFEPEETYQQVCDWFAGGGERYVVRDSFAVGDGASIADGSEKGVPTMICDSGETWTDDLTLTGYQEVELPQGYVPGDTIDLLLTVMYGTSVYYQDETGAYWAHVAQEENRGILHIPFTVSVAGETQQRFGTLTTGGYTATAKLTVSDVSVYGDVVFDAPAWAAAYQADMDDWANGAQGEPPAQPDWIENYALVAGSEILQNVSGGYGINADGKFHVLLEFSVPQNTDSLVLRPQGEAHHGEEIVLK